MRVERWDQKLDLSTSSDLLIHLCRVLLGRCEPSESKSKIEAALEGGGLLELCTLELNPATLSVVAYKSLRQILAFYQKRQDLDLGIDTKKVAWATFEAAEDLCLQTNRLFRQYSQGGFYFLPRVESVLYVAQRKISTILGDLPSFEDLRLRFGPGATTQVKKMDASARRKLSKPFACSEEACGSVAELLAEMPLWSQLPVDDRVVSRDVSVEEARIDFVRKTAKTDRTIAVEPMLNGMVQLAIGDFISARLRRFGVDLRDQTLNQRLARRGSTTGALATLDLSSASDTVSCGLVESLLPLDWWDFLRNWRTANVRTPLGPRKLEKFSTMGNGFTFALESLIFYALSKACEELTGPHEDATVSVYGDDIIVPVTSYSLLVETLTACGFVVNAKKSFSTGPFRESCGKDYYSGYSVRPAYLRGALTGEALFILHNFFVREGDSELAVAVRGVISDDCAIFGPDGFGDGHLLGDFVPGLPNRDRGYSGYTFETYTWKSPKAYYSLGADYVYPSYSIYMAGEADVDSGLCKLPLNAYRRSHGLVRPIKKQSSYKDGLLQDSLPGVRGYKRIRIYVLGKPDGFLGG